MNLKSSENSGFKPPEEESVNEYTSKIRLCADEISNVIKGKDLIIEKVLCAIIAQGHILLEDIPGVGKTTLAMTISKTMSLDYKRVQFTPDVLPGDITGFSIYNGKTHEFEYRQGAAFTNLFLADEINRTSPKTQSALLEVMEEGRITVDGVTRTLPEPFVVIATQNPVGSAGTQRLPESQMDRFLICLTVGYPDHENAIQILKGNSNEALAQLNSIITSEDVLKIQECADHIYVHESIYDYIVTLTEATRNPEYFLLGLSPRGSIAVLKMAKAAALVKCRNYVIPEDIHHIFYDVSCHRLAPSAKMRALGRNTQDILSDLLKTVPIPGAAQSRKGRRT